MKRVTAVTAIAVAGGFLGVCCGLPVLFSMGVLGAQAGVSVSSWVLIGGWLGVAGLGWARWVWHWRITTSTASFASTAAPVTPHQVVSTPKEHPR